MIAGHLDHRAVGRRRRYPETIPRALDDERRDGDRFELGQPALHGRRAARWNEREGEAEYADRAGRSCATACDTSAQRATADDESKIAELFGAETIDDGCPGCVEMVCGRRGAPSRDAVRLLDESDADSDCERDLRDGDEVRRGDSSRGSVTEDQRRPWVIGSVQMRARRAVRGV